jgi:hypothetical protein
MSDNWSSSRDKGLEAQPPGVDQTLVERGRRYGHFVGHAGLSQGIKEVMRGAAGWRSLAPDQREALEMVAHKVARILNGDPDYVDSWHDIAGYVRLVEQRLEGGGSDGGH